MNLGMVDVILPIYKPNHFVFEAINSVINQTYKNWILHIVDDASGDNSLEKIKQKYGFLNGKIKYYQLEKNRRQAFARNYAISKGNGEFIAFIDQDDVWVPEKLEWQVEYIEKNGTDAVHGNLIMINENGRVILNEKWEKENDGRRKVNWEQLNNEELARKIFRKPNIRIISSLVKRELFNKIGGFKDYFFGGEDEAFWFEIAVKGKIGFLDEYLFLRREHDLNTALIFKSERLKGYMQSVLFLMNNYSDYVTRKEFQLKNFKLRTQLIADLRKEKIYSEVFLNIIVLLLKYPIFSIKKIIKKL